MKHTKAKLKDVQLIEQAIQKARHFLWEKFQREGIITQATKSDDGWLVEIEVVEPSVYMKRLGVPAPVLERYRYEIVLDNNCQPVSFERRYFIPGRC